MSRQKRIFITGATGFVGANLVKHFALSAWEVLASSRANAPAPLLSLAKYIQSDITQVFPKQSADVVVHAAALASDTAARSDLNTANLEGTRHVYEATLDCPCFIYISSASVYDGQKSIHTEEESVDYNRLSPYGHSKRMAEEWLLKQDWSNRTLYILRPRAVYGLGDRVLLPRLLRLVKGGQLFAPGDMRIMSSLTHIHNLCLAVELCIQHSPSHHWSEFAGKASGKNIHILNVSDEEPYEMRQIVHQLLSAIHGKVLPVRTIPLLPLKHLSNVLTHLKIGRQFTPYSLQAMSIGSVLDLQKIKETLGYAAPHNFYNSLPELANWVVQTGVERVKQAASNLPWETEKTNRHSPE